MSNVFNRVTNILKNGPMIINLWNVFLIAGQASHQPMSMSHALEEYSRDVCFKLHELLVRAGLFHIVLSFHRFNSSAL